MRARTLILVALAILLAGGTGFLLLNYLARKDIEVVQSKESVKIAAPTKRVLIAHNDIKRGQILRPEDTSWQTWPEEGALDKNYIVEGGPPIPPRTPLSFAGTVARNPIAAGEPITDARVIAPGTRGFLAAVLRPGMRAISVPVSITSGIAGFVFPGDLVDLLLTYTYKIEVTPGSKTTGENKEPEKNLEVKTAETMLRNIRVIGIDQRMESKAGEVVPGHTATLEVTPKQSEIIALASKIGEMSLSLRSLVPTSQEAAATELATSETAGQNPPNSPVAETATYTLDDEVASPLPGVVTPLRQYLDKISNRSKSTDVTILRGGGTGGKGS